MDEPLPDPEPNSQTGAQSQLGFETRTKNSKALRDIAELSAAELSAALFQFIPASGRINREELLEMTSNYLGVPVRRARSFLNRTISDEKRAGRLEVDSGWENVWRA
ncbi:MAG: hypothetical protein DME24_00670 [Verrucomicrobia bacterium]|nr:MAG: hypothetical protein DME24_00670 [Verrucomicrobiota bacterium]